MHLAGSMAEGTRLGGADEIDVTLTFEAMSKYPFELCDDDEDAIDLILPDDLKHFELMTSPNGKFSYSKFINLLCKDLWRCMQKLDREKSLRLYGLTCDAHWKPCQNCRLPDAAGMVSLKHCDSCLPAVTYSKSGACLIFTWTDEFLSKRTLTMDLIPSFELTYFGNFASLSQRVFRSLYKTRPEGWDAHCGQLGRRDRLLMDWRSKADMLEQEHKRRTETTALKLINDHEGSGHYVIRPRQKLDSHALSTNPTLRKLYTILKALVKVLELEASSFLVKKHLLSLYGQSPEFIDECSGTPAREMLLLHRLPQILLKLEISAIFQEKIDLLSWVRSIQTSKDAFIAIRYVPIRNWNSSICSEEAYLEKIAKGMLNDHHFESFLYKDDKFHHAPESIQGKCPKNPNYSASFIIVILISLI